MTDKQVIGARSGWRTGHIDDIALDAASNNIIAVVGAQVRQDTVAQPDTKTLGEEESTDA